MAEPFKQTVIGIVALGVISSLIAMVIWTDVHHERDERNTSTQTDESNTSTQTTPPVVYTLGSPRIVQTPPAPVPLAPAPNAPTLAPTAQLADKFTEDVALKADTWTSGTPFLNSIAGAQGLHLVPANLTFGQTGMTLSGVTGLYEFTGVQSVRTLSPPISLRASAVGTVAHGNPIDLYLVSSDLSEYVVIHGNLNPQNGNYHGMSLAFTSNSRDVGRSQDQPLPVAAADVDIGRWYIFSINIDAEGYGDVTVADGAGTVLATETHFKVGSGPFHVVLGQSEGWPYTGGANEAIWSWVEVN